MAVITISREFGSEGTAIAEKAAQALGYHLADKNSIEKILSEYGLMEFDRMYDSIPGFWDRFDAHRMERRAILIDMLNKTLMALAGHGNTVIVGRGGFAVLADLADVLNVRIQAPMQMRTHRVMELPDIAEPSRAEIVVKENDRLQKGFVESVYGVHWDSVKNFDLVIDTGKVAPDLAVDWIAAAARHLKAPAMGGVRTVANLKLDKILAATVNEFFKCEQVHSR